MHRTSTSSHRVVSHQTGLSRAGTTWEMGGQVLGERGPGPLPPPKRKFQHTTLIVPTTSEVAQTYPRGTLSNVEMAEPSTRLLSSLNQLWRCPITSGQYRTKDSLIILVKSLNETPTRPGRIYLGLDSEVAARYEQNASKRYIVSLDSSQHVCIDTD